MKYLLLICLVGLLAFVPTVAQQSTQENTTATKKSLDRQRQGKERRGTIKGRVVAEGGQPLAQVGVSVFSAGSQSVNRRSVGTDEEGKFDVDDLPPAAYSVTAGVPGYIAAPAGANERKTYRIGETVVLTMIKGGVITGVVKSAAGEPLISVPVRALRIKDGDGRPTRSQNYGRDRQTDDRGVYRLYGLEPGTYVVIAGGSTNFYPGFNRFGDDVPTYYPSATRDTAVEVLVQAGQETVGIDISYRGEKGHAVSGTMAGVPSASQNFGLNVLLLHAATGLLEATATINYNDRRSFAFYGIPDGDYYLVAESFTWQNEKDHAASHIRRLSVKGADVTGLELTLTPMASLAGRVVLEPLAGADGKTKCEGKREAGVEEMILTFLRETRGDVTTAGWLRGTVPTAVDDRGTFAAYRLYADRYRLDVNLPTDAWYLKAIVLGEAAKVGVTSPRSAQANEVVSKGVALKAGDKVENLLITVAEGAAAVSGKVVTSSEAERLPARLRVYVVPAEKERAEDLLRYAQVEAQSDGTFTLANLAPGKYWLISKEIPGNELDDVAPRPAFWDIQSRAALRKEAEAANTSLELQTCQQIKELRLRYSAASAAPKPAIKKL